MRFLLVLFILVPIAEIFVLIKVGQVVGALPTIAMILLTAVAGVALLRQQGYSAIARAKQKMEQGTMPAGEMVEGLFLAVGGALLLTPGFITDAVGLCCLLPGVRRLLIRWSFARLFKGQVVTVRRSDGPGRTLEGDYKREE